MNRKIQHARIHFKWMNGSIYGIFLIYGSICCKCGSVLHNLKIFSLVNTPPFAMHNEKFGKEW